MKKSIINEYYAAVQLGVPSTFEATVLDLEAAARRLGFDQELLDVTEFIAMPDGISFYTNSGIQLAHAGEWIVIFEKTKDAKRFTHSEFMSITGLYTQLHQPISNAHKRFAWQIHRG